MGAAYLFLSNGAGFPATPSTALSDPLSIANDNFGFSVAGAGDVNGDGYSDVIIGAYGVSSSRGAAYFYLSNGTGFPSSPSISLTDPPSIANDNFGFSVAGAGDVNGDGYSDIIVGAYGVTSGTGAAYLFLGSSSATLSSVTTLNGIVAGGNFGISVACVGDINGDGYSDVMAGAEAISTSTGKAYLYLGSSTGIPTSPSQTIDGLSASSSFGFSVASAGDINGDGYSDVIIGAPNLSGNIGAAYLYQGSASGIISTASFTLNGSVGNGYFGCSVACAGDVNGDGYNDVIIGADQVSSFTGAAYLFLGSPVGLPSSPSSTINGLVSSGYFGESVACAGDVNSDGYSDVIIGAPQANSLSGAAYLYLGGPGGLTYSSTLNGVSNNDQFGVSVAGAGDINGDGYGDVIIGAYQYPSGGAKGTAYLFLGSSTGLPTSFSTQLNDPNNANGDQFGVCVAGAGDVNGDGFNDIIIGASGVSSSKGAAYLYLGSPIGLPSSPSTPLSDVRGTNSDQFGVCVAGAGDVNGDGYSDVIVGAHGVLASKGEAYIYLGSSSGLNTAVATTLSGSSANDLFGVTDASAGDVNGDGYSDVIVGAYGVSGGAGAAYVFHGSSTGLSSSAATTLTGSSGGFGYRVAGAGDINGDGFSDIISGAPGFSASTGAAYYFYGNGTNGMRNNLRLYNADLVTPIQQSNFYEANLFGAGLYAKSFLGRQKGRLVWETVKNGNPFSGNPITNSTAYTAQTAIDSVIDLTGKELKHQIAKQLSTKATYIRARVKYDKVTAITGQVYSPWRYPEGFLRGKRDVGSVALPLKFISFTAVKQNNAALLRWITTDEEPGVQFEVQHSADGINFITLTSINGRNQTRNEYEWLHVSPAKGNNFYRIRASENNKTVLTVTRLLNFSDPVVINIYPNPVSPGHAVTIENTGIVQNEKLSVSLFNMSGQNVLQKEMKATENGRMQINIPDLPSGAYLLQMRTRQWEYRVKIIVPGE